VTKKRYDNLVSNSQSLKRIFSSPNSSKYPTLGKFLPIFSKQQTIVAGDLDLLDQLIDQTLLNRNQNYSQDAVANISDVPTTGRAKEMLNQQLTESVKAQESAVETQAEVAPNPELVELSKEIQEVSKETKEQREQALIKEKQQEINTLATEATTPVAVSDKPVVVLPITQKSKEEAKFKTTKYSVRWLLEWCKKVAKMFSGAVVYKEEVDYE